MWVVPCCCCPQAWCLEVLGTRGRSCDQFAHVLWWRAGGTSGQSTLALAMEGQLLEGYNGWSLLRKSQTRVGRTDTACRAVT
jgi:hypothetical protein